jgi:hypothetical protein
MSKCLKAATSGAEKHVYAYPHALEFERYKALK